MSRRWWEIEIAETCGLCSSPLVFVERSGDDNAVVLKAFVVSICPHALMMPEHHEQHSNAVCNLQYTISATCSFLYSVEMRLCKVSECAEPGPLSTMCRGRICTDKVLQTVGCSEKVCFPHQPRSLAISIMSSATSLVRCDKRYDKCRHHVWSETLFEPKYSHFQNWWIDFAVLLPLQL